MIWIMSAKKSTLIVAILISLSLGGCASVTKPRIPKPQAPSSVAKGCPYIPYIDGDQYKKLTPEQRTVYKDALLNMLRCNQNRQWILRLHKSWP
jgi:hypothetical protein